MKKVMLVISLCLALVACSKYTQDNFNKIQPGMTLKQVTQILGEPTSTQSMDFAGISGTSATWQDKNTQITLQFLNDKVQIKTFNKVDASSNSPTS